MQDSNLPSIQDLCLNRPLYEIFVIREEDIKLVISSFRNSSINCYCKDCSDNSIFSMAPFQSDYGYKSERLINSGKERILSFTFSCVRDPDQHQKHYFLFLLKETKLMKIGQYPSLTTLASIKNFCYRKILGNGYEEYTRAIELAGQGVGIGAFVYLRRVLDELLRQMILDDSTRLVCDEVMFKKLKMKDKFDLLKDSLPEFLFQQDRLTQVLNKGVHDLEEDECLSAFDSLKTCIELILDERLYQQEKQRKISYLEAATSIV